MWLIAFLVLVIVLLVLIWAAARSAGAYLLRERRGQTIPVEEGEIAIRYKAPDGFSFRIRVLAPRGPERRKAVILAGPENARDMADFFRRQGCYVITAPVRGMKTKFRGTLGFRESRDLSRIWTVVRDRLPEGTEAGIYGVGVGAAAGILCACADDRIRFIAAEAAWPDPDDWVRCQLAMRALPSWPILGMARAQAKWLRGVRYSKVSPRQALAGRGGLMTVPLMLIGPAHDPAMPPRMTEVLADAKQGPKTILLCEEGGAGQAFPADPEGYRAALLAFLESIDQKESL